MTLLFFWGYFDVIPCHFALVRCCEVICACGTATGGGGVKPAEKEEFIIEGDHFMIHSIEP